MDERRTFYIWTIGCQMNEGDSRRLAELLAARGYEPVSAPEAADIIVLNTCVVRRSAEERVLGRLASLKPLKRRNPRLLLAVMGCAVGQEPETSPLPKQFPFVDLWLPPSRYELLLQLVPPRAGAKAATSLAPLVSRYVTIMTGCSNFCAYCIVPLRRGPERSKPPEVIEQECRELVAAGAREVILLGQNVNSYGQDLPSRPTLAELLHRLHPIQGLWRIRFLTNHPKDMSEQLIRTVAELPKVCEHIELPVQSGSDEVLERMNRCYTRGQYLSLVQRLRAAIPALSLATDVIVGFPGETEAQFQETCSLLEEVRFDVVHVACYSPRPGTAAAKLPDDIPPEEKERRREVIERLQERIAGEINARLLGKEVEVLVEEKTKGKWRGRTRTNKLVFFPHDGDLAGKLALVRVTWAGPWSLVGEFTGCVPGPD
jgi:tRNA-2-methylthio-N6-dimethylallyladenosine synthase